MTAPSVTPFHYTALLTDFTLAMQHVLQAQDWKEGLGPALEHPAMVRQQQELGNLRAALARVRGTYLALEARLENLRVDVSLHEKAAIAESAPAIATALDQADGSALPADLRSESDA